MIKWLDLIDQTKLNQLVNSYNLHLNNTTCSFLESFANLVYQASNTRRKLLDAANLRKAHLHTVNSIIAHELFHLQKQLPHAQIIPYRHPETSLPIVYVRLHQLPDLVVHVFRSYVTNNYGLTFGFRAYSFCRGPLTGPIASAANYLRARCTAKSWKISVSELISLWCHHVATISTKNNSPSLPLTNKPRKMIRRRRRTNRSPSPPLAEHANFQSSLPHDHPNTDVIIKDDRLFPNRTFHDPEELYAEQVRAIRNKRKHPSGIIDDAELAWKKLRPSTPHQPSDEQSHPCEQKESQQQPTPPPQPPLPSAPQPPPPQSASDSPIETPPLIPPLTPPAKPSLETEPVPAEDSGDVFINPLSPEPKDESPPENPQLLGDTVQTPSGRKRAPSPEPKPPSPPSPPRRTEADSPPPADADADADADANADDDDGSTPVFSFSTAVLSHAPTPTPTPTYHAPALDSQTEHVKPDSVEKPEAVSAQLKQAEDTRPVNSEPSNDTIKIAPESVFEETGSNESPRAKPSLSLPTQDVDQGSQENECDTPTTLQNDSNSISPQGSTPLVPGLDKEFPEDIDEAYKLRNDELDRTRASPHEAEASPQVEEEKVEKDSATVSVGKSKKRSRTRDYDADVIVVDPDSDEEPDETNKGKKRRLSAPSDVPDFSAPRSDQRSTRDINVTGKVKKKDTASRKKEKVSGGGAEEVVSEIKEGSGTQARENSDHPFLRKEDSRSVEKSGSDDSVDGVNMRTETQEVRRSSAKEVTRDVESRFMSYGGASIPAGVDRDPCPMVLSEPSESSEGSSDDDSNSDSDSVSDGTPDSDNERG